MNFLEYSLNKFHTVCVLDILICHLQGTMYVSVRTLNLCKCGPGLEIATHWLPMRPKIEHWRLNFQNWSPADDTIAFRPITKENQDTTFVFKFLH